MESSVLYIALALSFAVPITFYAALICEALALVGAASLLPALFLPFVDLS